MGLIAITSQILSEMRLLPRLLPQLPTPMSEELAQWHECQGWVWRNKKHPEKKLVLFCLTCNESICKNCTIKLHRNHDYDLLKDVGDECGCVALAVCCPRKDSSSGSYMPEFWE